MLYLKGMRRVVFQLSGFYRRSLRFRAAVHKGTGYVRTVDLPDDDDDSEASTACEVPY